MLHNRYCRQRQRFLGCGAQAQGPIINGLHQRNDQLGIGLIIQAAMIEKKRLPAGEITTSGSFISNMFKPKQRRAGAAEAGFARCLSMPGLARTIATDLLSKGG
jgi:hypothetical protein